MNMKSRVITDLCGNRYYVEEARDFDGAFLEVSEIVNIDGTDMKTYLCDVGQTLASPDDEILEDIDDFRSKGNDE